MKEFYDSEVMRLSSIIEEWRAKFELLDRERMK